MKGYRVGIGIDLHRFSKKKKALILGGARVPFSFGLKAVSDGDVILHAVSDALCGACCLGDIGDYFPPEAEESSGINSRQIVRFVLEKVKKKFKIVNIDITVVADKPRLSIYKKDILKTLKKIFLISEVNLKIKSKENGSFLGSKNSISALAVVLVKHNRGLQ